MVLSTNAGAMVTRAIPVEVEDGRDVDWRLDLEEG